jgi:GT2 family glycosyltransferase
MRLSVIIPAYNQLDTVMRCIASVMRTTDQRYTEALVQDDASPDINLPSLIGPACQRNTKNLGFPGNCNAGAARATGDILLFLNQDVTITQPGWDTRLREWFAILPKMAIAGPTLLFPNGRVQSVGGAFDSKGQPYHVALGAQNPDWEPINTPRRVGWVTGAALAIRIEVWQALQGFDTVYGRGYFEDVDLCVRAQVSGFDVWHLPGIRMWHQVGSTGGNSQIMANAQVFKTRWVDTGVIEPDTHFVKERFWA